MGKNWDLNCEIDGCVEMGVKQYLFKLPRYNHFYRSYRINLCKKHKEMFSEIYEEWIDRVVERDRSLLRELIKEKIGLLKEDNG
jgi:hypothetical protein